MQDSFGSRLYKKMAKIGDRFDENKEKREAFTRKHGRKIAVAVCIFAVVTAFVGHKVLPEIVSVYLSFEGDVSSDNYRIPYIAESLLLCFGSSLVLYLTRKFIWLFAACSSSVAFLLTVISHI